LGEKVVFIWDEITKKKFEAWGWGEVVNISFIERIIIQKVFTVVLSLNTSFANNL